MQAKITENDAQQPSTSGVTITRVSDSFRDTGADAAVTKSTANGLIRTGLPAHTEQTFKGLMGGCEVTTPSSFSLTSNRVDTNY